MKKFAMMAAFCFSTAAVAEYKTGSFPTSIDDVYDIESETSGVLDCADQIDEDATSYCIQRSYDSRNIYVEAYVLVRPGHAGGRYNTKEKLLAAYTNFEKWPTYIENSGLDSVVAFPESRVLFDETAADGNRKIAHYFDYSSKAPIIGSLRVTGTSTYNIFATPADGAVVSAEFKGTNSWGDGWTPVTPLPGGASPKGIKGQDANFHIVELEDGEGFIMVYRTRIRLSISIALSLTNSYVSNALEDILVGMVELTPQDRD